MIQWPIPDRPPTVHPDRLQIWAVPLDLPAEQVARCHGLLAPNEAERAGRFLRPQDRRRYAVARASLRLLLAACLRQKAAQIRFGYGALGKPCVAQPDEPLPVTFNLSHSHELAVIACTRGRRVGIDLEQLDRPQRLLDLAATVFSPREQAALGALDPAQQTRAFYNGWTRKEAFIKALGDGLSYPLQQFDVSLAPHEPARLLGLAGDPEGHRCWSMAAFEPERGYVGAAVVEGESAAVTYWRFALAHFPGG